MKGFVDNIEKISGENEDFRRVLYTSRNSQLVVMSIAPGIDIGKETHHLDQFIRVEEGRGVAEIDGVKHTIESGFAILVPAGSEHNITNTSDIPLKLYTLYAPPNHRDRVIHPSKEASEKDTETFDGKTSE